VKKIPSAGCAIAGAARDENKTARAMSLTMTRLLKNAHVKRFDRAPMC
jgi:hypothetical protein